MLTTVNSGRAAPGGGNAMELQTLESLPCGCILAIQRLRLSDVTVTSVEAKGPHCTILAHRSDKVINLGNPFDADYLPLDDESLPSLAA
jgi:hypothetical protein